MANKKILVVLSEWGWRSSSHSGDSRAVYRQDGRWPRTWSLGGDLVTGRTGQHRHLFARKIVGRVGARVAEAVGETER